MSTDRKLARIEAIGSILPIPNADAIELVTILGWQCVVKKGEFQPGDLCVYFEIDSFLPVKDEFEFLRKGCLRVMEGIEGFRLRTMKLRGALSQGLALPIASVTGLPDNLQVGDDVTEAIGITKWEPPIPAGLAGNIKGAFPSFVPKTDEERVQNLLLETMPTGPYIVTEKLDGTSFTCFFKDGVFGVCGRNWEQHETEGSAYWRVANRLKLREQLTELGRNLAIQGELVGPGVQENSYNLKVQDLYVFNAYDIDNACYLTHFEMSMMCASLDINHVPVIAEIKDLSASTMDEIIEFADGDSAIGPCLREGVVFKTKDRSVSFKAISNKFLCNEK